MRWFVKINQTAFSWILCNFLAIFLAIGNYGDPKHYFVGSLTPEITGVIIELLVVIWVFNKWQDHSIKKKLISIERRLREYHIFFLKHNFKDLPKKYRVKKFYGKDHEENIEYLHNLRMYLKTNTIDHDVLTTIHTHCKREASTMSSLLPVAAELTNIHFKSWCRIVYFVNDIASQDIGQLDEEMIKTSTIDIIQNITRFDEESYKRKLYVGAENV